MWGGLVVFRDCTAGARKRELWINGVPLRRGGLVTRQDSGSEASTRFLTELRHRHRRHLSPKSNRIAIDARALTPDYRNPYSLF